MSDIHLIDEHLRRAAQTHPENLAVVDRSRSMTYRELAAQSARLSNLLVEEGVERGDRVGLYLDKSLESLIAIYGILQAGATYVPFDPNAPVARLAYIAQNAGIRCLLSGTEKAPEWADLLESATDVETLVVPNAAQGSVVPPGRVRLRTGEALAEYPTTAPGLQRQKDDLAYILYTSGSTGDPKGVMLSHENALAFVDWTFAEFAVRPSDRLSSHAPLHFDLSVFDLYAAAEAAATVVLVPPETSVFPVDLARWIALNRITVWYSVPSILSMLVLRGKLEAVDFSALRAILFAGEVFPTKYLAQLMDALPRVRFANLYGPTETNVCTFFDVPSGQRLELDDIPIGKPIADVDVWAANEDGSVVPHGDVGELWVHGPTVMHGYWGDPERTARSLVTDARGRRCYRTGDLVRCNAEGDYLFLGRRDAQIKSRGYRIELGEIETALYAHPDVVECAVSAIPDDVVTNRIKAYIVGRNGLDTPELVRFCRERLPRYMIPEIFEFRHELPKSSTGKIARRALEHA